jgi:hypothetical protein
MPIFVGDANYAHAKGGCYRCGRGDRLVDLDAQIEGEGALVICVPCIGEAAEVAGLHFNEGAVAEMRVGFEEERRQFSPERVKELEAELAGAKAELLVAHQVEARMQAALAHIAPKKVPAKK